MKFRKYIFQGPLKTARIINIKREDMATSETVIQTTCQNKTGKYSRALIKSGNLL